MIFRPTLFNTVLLYLHYQKLRSEKICIKHMSNESLTFLWQYVSALITIVYRPKFSSLILKARCKNLKFDVCSSIFYVGFRIEELYHCVHHDRVMRFQDILRLSLPQLYLTELMLPWVPATLFLNKKCLSVS